MLLGFMRDHDVLQRFHYTPYERKVDLSYLPQLTYRAIHVNNMHDHEHGCGYVAFTYADLRN